MRSISAITSTASHLTKSKILKVTIGKAKMKILI